MSIFHSPWLHKAELWGAVQKENQVKGEDSSAKFAEAQICHPDLPDVHIAPVPISNYISARQSYA